MNASMQAPATPQHDLVAMTAALRGALLNRVEQGIQSSGLKDYLQYLLTKRLVFAGPMSAEALAGELHQNPRDVAETLGLMERQALARHEGNAWSVTDAGRGALAAANDSGNEVLNDIRNAIGASACDQLVAGMRGALAALRKAA
ncbi:MAG: hypothetical protein ACREPY_16360 [Rhodanobacteraceae bacterium]